MEKCKETVLDEIQEAGYITEDSIPLSVGQWPEYARTLKICVDSFDTQLACGVLYTYYFEKTWDFHSLDQLLFALESITLLVSYPQPDTELRRNFSTRSSRKKCNDDKERIWAKPQKLIPYYSINDLELRHGRLANFHIRIMARQHSSMQGFLTWIEEKKQIAFRSELELLLLLRNVLNIAQEKHK